MTDAEVYDTLMKAAVGVLILAAWTYVVLDQRDLRRALRRQRTQLHQYRRAIVQLQGAATHPPTTVGQPMSVVQPRNPRPAMAIPAHHHTGQEEANGGWKQAVCDTDATLRLTRPPALSDVAAAILGTGRPLTRATLDTQLDRDTRTEVRNGLLAGTLQMVRTHDDEPAYWPTGHPVPGDTVRMAKMPVLPGLVRP